MKTFAVIRKEMAESMTGDKTQYKSLNNAIRSIYNRQITPEQKEEQPTADQLAVIQNRKIQYQRKIIDNA